MATLNNPKSSRSSRAPVIGSAYHLLTVGRIKASAPSLMITPEACRQAHHFMA